MTLRRGYTDVVKYVSQAPAVKHMSTKFQWRPYAFQCQGQWRRQIHCGTLTQQTATVLPAAIDGTTSFTSEVPSKLVETGRPIVAATGSFPSVSLPSSTGGLSVDVNLVAQLGHGAGSALFTSVIHRQRQHALFLDELDEPSAKLASCDFAKGDATSLYTFAVGARGHPFHRHEGHRVFVAISGSSGARLRFCSVSPAELDKDPQLFLQRLRQVEIPPDCLFSVRFGGETWHQFAPLDSRSGAPAFVALSVHTNELGGNLAPELAAQVRSGTASIPSLTQLLPNEVADLMAAVSAGKLNLSIPTTRLRLDAPSESILAAACQLVRVSAGRMRSAWTNVSPLGLPGFQEWWGGSHVVQSLSSLPTDSLLLTQTDQQLKHVDHHDTCQITLSLDNTLMEKLGATSLDHDTLPPPLVTSSEKGVSPPTSSMQHRLSASRLLSGVLEGFVNAPPAGVSRLMSVRNVLVRPLGLRTSPLGCPISSLLSPKQDNLFAGRFPVRAQRINSNDAHAQVILGADDKHLQFRTVVSVRIQPLTERDESDGIRSGNRVEISMSTQVGCRNLFGKLYMHLIDRVHRTYVAPTLIRTAVEYALR
jgi:hypothetical protein